MPCSDVKIACLQATREQTRLLRGHAAVQSLRFGNRKDNLQEACVQPMRLRPRSCLARMLAALFRHGSVGRDHLAALTGSAYADTYLCRAKRMNLVQVRNDTIHLSARGRWYCLAVSLGVTFSELCVLSDMYCSYILGSRAGVVCYVKRSETFDAMHIAEGTAGKILHSIVRKGHALCKFGHCNRYDPAVMYLAHDTYEFLHRYDWDVIMLWKAIFCTDAASMISSNSGKSHFVAA